MHKPLIQHVVLLVQVVLISDHCISCVLVFIMFMSSLLWLYIYNVQMYIHEHGLL